MELTQHQLSVLDLTIGPDLLSSSLDEEVVLQCTITNQKTLPFRLRKNWTFTRPNDPYGTLQCDILLDGKIYQDWQSSELHLEEQNWTSDDIVILKHGESHTFTANLTDAYPLLHRGTYTLQATFHPEKLKGVMVSKCKPVLSNLITLVVW